MTPPRLAIVGATGLVGRTMLRVLEERQFPLADLRLLASARSAGTSLSFRGEAVPVEELREGALRGVDVALFSAGAAVSRAHAREAARAGCLVIDNSSAFRMDPEVPLVVPEVNPEEIDRHRGIIANPNCSTIQMVVALKPLHDRWRLRRIVVSTYQAVTGAGKRAVDQLADELAGRKAGARAFPHAIASNVLPQVDIFESDGYTREEHKMVNETRKILAEPNLRIAATCARVPVVGGHSEAVGAEFERPFSLEEVNRVLRGAPGVKVLDEPGRSLYPMPFLSDGTDDVLVGRIRIDPSVPNGLCLWIVADNLRKGAATNAVQIAEAWARRRARGAGGPPQ